jgi:hypothetical protein
VQKLGKFYRVFKYNLHLVASVWVLKLAEKEKDSECVLLFVLQKKFAALQKLIIFLPA